MLSIAAERAVELLKNGILKKLNSTSIVYQVLSGIIGGVLCYYSPPPTTIMNLNEWVTVFATGLAVSGGSAFWNSLLDSLMNLSKSLKPVPVKE